LVLVRRIDGPRTIGEIADGIDDARAARQLFHTLWRLDFISVRLATDGADRTA